jgi:hypothetical protein
MTWPLAVSVLISIFELGGAEPSLRAGRVHNDCYSPYDEKSYMEVSTCVRGGNRTNLNLELEEKGCTTIVEDKVFRAGCSKSYVICDKTVQLMHGVVSEVFTDDAGGAMRAMGLPLGWNGSHRNVDFYTQWRDYDAIMNRLQEVVGAAAGVATLEPLSPTTHEGRTIYAVRIRDPAWTEGAPRIVLNSLQHAREWIASMVGTYLAEYCVTKKASEPNWLAGMELVIVPIANPDGFIYSQTQYAYWRKNRAWNQGSSCRGVDLNRNWGTDWNGAHSTSTNPCSDIYVGSSAHSEPETMALKALMEASKPAARNKTAADAPAAASHQKAKATSSRLAPAGVTKVGAAATKLKNGKSTSATR